MVLPRCVPVKWELLQKIKTSSEVFSFRVTIYGKRVLYIWLWRQADGYDFNKLLYFENVLWISRAIYLADNVDVDILWMILTAPLWTRLIEAFVGVILPYNIVVNLSSNNNKGRPVQSLCSRILPRSRGLCQARAPEVPSVDGRDAQSPGKL